MTAVLLAIVGVALVIAGTALLSVPVSLIVAGLACAGFALLADLDRKAD